jgi:hypothetical protein
MSKSSAAQPMTLVETRVYWFEMVTVTWAMIKDGQKSLLGGGCVEVR